jgi:Na+-translocating ferredoxin:NAD+ oxidoreductase RnfD subunit
MATQVRNGNWSQKIRLGGLRRFAVAITVFNILGHTVFGFEQSWLHPFVALATGYSLHILLEIISAATEGRTVRFRGGWRKFVDFLLPAHISALAVSMLIYPNARLWPIAFATAVAIGSKSIFRIPVGKGTRHLFNPSNIGISTTLLLFPWVGIAPPYHFTENLFGAGDWILPAIIAVSGTMLNMRFTRKLPLISAWVGGFVFQAFVRSFVFGTPVVAALLPMTGVAFVLYTFYMVTDPPTTPPSARGQVCFGAAVAATYSLLMMLHVVFGLFFALTIVSAARGIGVYALAYLRQRRHAEAPARAAADVVVGETAVARSMRR